MQTWWSNIKRLRPIFTKLQKYGVLSNVAQKPQDYNLAFACENVGVYGDQKQDIMDELIETEALLRYNTDTYLAEVTEKGKIFIKDFEESTGEYLEW